MEKIIIILKGLLVLFVALFIGGEVNMFIVENGHKLISNPPGTDFTNAEGLKKSMHLMVSQRWCHSPILLTDKVALPPTTSWDAQFVK